MKQQSPSPDNYRISDSIGYENGPYKTRRTIKPHFLKDSRCGIDQLFTLHVDREPVPGPGSYNYFSEFSNSRKFAASVRKAKTRRSSKE